MQPQPPPQQQPLFGNNEYKQGEQTLVQSLLNRKLGPEYVAQRSGAGGTRVHYLEGHRAIELANSVFGFNGWSSSVQDMTIDFMDDVGGGKWNVGVSATVRITLKDGAFHEDIGYGMIDNTRSKGQALEKAKKEAVTDALKRALRLFGNALGNCMYDKSFTKDIGRVQSMGAGRKLDEDNLMRPDTARTAYANAAVEPTAAHAAPSSTGETPMRSSSSPATARVAPSPAPSLDPYDTSMDMLMMDLPGIGGNPAGSVQQQTGSSVIQQQPRTHAAAINSAPNALKQSTPPMNGGTATSSVYRPPPAAAVSSNSNVYRPPPAPTTGYRPPSAQNGNDQRSGPPTPTLPTFPLPTNVSNAPGMPSTGAVRPPQNTGSVALNTGNAMRPPSNTGNAVRPPPPQQPSFNNQQARPPAFSNNNNNNVPPKNAQNYNRPSPPLQANTAKHVNNTFGQQPLINKENRPVGNSGFTSNGNGGAMTGKPMASVNANYRPPMNGGVGAGAMSKPPPMTATNNQNVNASANYRPPMQPGTGAATGGFGNAAQSAAGNGGAMHQQQHGHDPKRMRQA